ncbi:GNAT family N-acetyltransferase [Puniceicoccaceae bacterium K14]|nr:GNAT family N-acetyltransferase [Puniceicoccaceae bacterium K14]
MDTLTEISPRCMISERVAPTQYDHEWVKGCASEQKYVDDSKLNFFHYPEWVKCLEESYHYKAFTLLQKKGVNSTAHIPLVEVNSWISGKRGISLPYTDFCPPMCENQSSFDAAFKEIIRFGLERKWRYIELRDSGDYLAQHPSSTQFHSHKLELLRNEDDQFNNLASSTRRAIRKAEKSGLEISVSRKLTDLNAFYKLQCMTRKRHGLPAQPYTFFKNIHHNILETNKGVVFLAKLNGTAAAGALFLNNEKKTIYKFGASDINIQATRANNFVMWEAIKWHINRGFNELHFGRSSLAHKGLRAYKLRWGAKEGSINYYRYNLKTRKFTVHKDAVSGWYNAFFSHLPIPFSQYISKLIYRHAA